MEIEYTLTADDLVAFSLYHLNQGPAGWRRYLTLFWGVVAFFSLSSLVQIGKLLVGQDAWADLVFTLAIVGTLLVLRCGWWLWQPIALRRATRKDLAAADAKARSYLEQRLKLTSEGIVQVTPLATSLTDWAAVEKIALTDHHAFIYIATDQAYTVPERTFRNEGEFHAFVDQARAFQQAAARTASGALPREEQLSS